MTHRKAALRKIVIASHNPGKISEIQALLEPLGFETVSAAALGLPEPEETGATFVANARLKAHAAATASGYPVLSDDSGLVVPALGGLPGVFSARWGGPAKDFRVAMQRVERELTATLSRDRRAALHCALCLGSPDRTAIAFESSLAGHLVWPPRGSGSGYEPMFVPNGQPLTLAEMPAPLRHELVPRTSSLAKLSTTLTKLLAGAA